MAKTYSQTYLFKQYTEYEKKIYEFIMTADRIDVQSKEFEDVLYDFKRRNINSNLLKIITSKNVILGIGKAQPLPKAFKVFVAKDVKESKDTLKVFIDVTDCIMFKNGLYVCPKLEWLISYVINAMTSYIYAMSESRLVGNASVLKDGGAAFTKCFSYTIDRLYKVSTVQQLKKRVDYAIALYYQVNILGKSFEKSFDTIKANALRIADADPKDVQLVDMSLEQADFIHIEAFIQALSKIFNFKDLKVSNVVDTWMKAFGTGTIFALEFFPAFSAMMTNTYVGGYLDQQMTIEKIAGNSMVSFTKTILQIGASV